MNPLDELLRRLLTPIFYLVQSLVDSGGLKPGDVISFLALCVSVLGFGAAAVGILFTYQQVKLNQETNRAALLKEFYTTMFADEDVRTAWYMIEYNRFVYDGDEGRRDPHFHESELEKKIDRLLTFVDLLCSLHSRGLITDGEMNFFKYEIRQMYTSEDLDKYLRFVKGSYARNVDIVPYKAYFDYCERTFGIPNPRFRSRSPAPSAAQPDDAYFVLPIEKAKAIHLWLR